MNTPSSDHGGMDAVSE
jgi:hypothetical protein